MTHNKHLEFTNKNKKLASSEVQGGAFSARRVPGVHRRGVDEFPNSGDVSHLACLEELPEGIAGAWQRIHGSLQNIPAGRHSNTKLAEPCITKPSTLSLID